MFSRKWWRKSAFCKNTEIEEEGLSLCTKSELIAEVTNILKNIFLFTIKMFSFVRFID